MQNAARPLSPHLSVYKFKYTFITSFANRLSGVALTVALIPLVYWLVAAGGGRDAYDRASRTLSSPIVKIIIALFALAMVYHLVAGIRHLVWDTGRGLERAQSKRSAALVIVVSLVLFVLLAVWWTMRGAA
jgi:succinate dehydrogenase cytochrome b556 subunit